MSIGKFLKYQSEINGEKTAVIYQSNRFTFKELNYRSNQLANGLVKLGITKGDKVAALMLNGIAFLETLFACAKLGAVFVPVNYRLASREVQYILDDSGAKALICHDHLDVIRHNAIDLQRLFRIQVGENNPEYETLLASNSRKEPNFDVDPGEVAILMYTSGTSGNPKGVLHTHSNIISSAFQHMLAFPISQSDITLSVAPLFHIGGLCMLTIPVLMKGGTVLIEDKFEPVTILEQIENENVTCTFMVPSMWHSLIQTDGFETYRLESLRYIVSGGSPCPLPLLEFFQKKGIRFLQAYGMTEIAPITILGYQDAERKISSVGKPSLDTKVRIVGEDGNETPPGEAGEIYVQGPHMMKGYWNLPQETKESFQNGWFATGDMGMRDEDGFIYIMDRKKDMIITGGENVYPSEVEQVLLQHPNIKEVAVIGIPDEKWGEAIKACVVLKHPEKPLSIDEVRIFCEEKVARYKIPKIIEILDQLPKNTVGKVQKHILQDSYFHNEVQ